MMTKRAILLIYGGYLILLSLLTFLLYAADKRKAKKGRWRISEKGLLLASFLGGAYGGYAAMLLLRHKTRREHWYFTAVNLLAILIHTALLFCIWLLFDV